MSPSSVSVRRRRLRPWIVGALVLAFDLLVLVHLHDRFWWPPDDGAYAHPAERMLQGEVLHRDVHEAHPAIHFLNEASLAVFGDRLVSLRYPLVAVSFAQALLVYLLLILSDAGAGELTAAAGALATMAFGFVQYLNPQPSWYCAFLTVAAAAVLRAPPSRRRNAALGLLAGLAAIVRQLTGAVLIAALVTWLLTETSTEPGHEMGRETDGHEGGSPLLARAIAALVALGIAVYLLRSTNLLGFALFGAWPLALAVLAVRDARDARVGARAVLSRLLPFAAGGIAAALPLVAFHALHGSLGALYDDAVKQALVISRLPYLTWASYGSAIEASAARVANGVYWLVLPLAGAILGLLAFGSRLRRRPLHPLVHLAVFYGIVSLLNQIPIYLYYTLTLTLPALLVALSPNEGSNGSHPVRRRTAAAFVIVLSGIALRHHAAQPLARGLDGIYAGTRLGVVPIGIPKLAIWTDPEDAAVYRALLARIEAATAPGEPIFVFPNDAEIYYLSGRRNPFAFFNTAVDIRTPADAAAAVQGLARVRPKLVLFVPDDKYRTPALAPVVRFVRGRYRLDARIGRFEVYRLPPAPEAPGPAGAAAR
jgi:hypothetical protein